MHDDDKTYRGAVVRLTELVDEDGILERFAFVRCTLKGPAVLVPLGHTAFMGNRFGDPEALLWEIPEDRERVSGAIAAIDCTFEECEFTNVGLAGPPDFVQAMKRDFGLS